MKEALFSESKMDGKVLCRLCPHGCLISEGGRGLCRARVNQDGILYAESYGRVSSLALDPIEKKPLNQFHPGSRVLSAGSYGCSLTCPFCQNHEILMETPETEMIEPEMLVQLALEAADRGNIGIAYTYNEPMVGIEYVLDCAKLAGASGLYNILVTNGFVCEEPLLALLPHIDAMNIDLKGFTDAFYKGIHGGLEDVKRTIRIAASACHVEVTTLIIPGENDGEEEMAELSGWLAGIDPGIPLHLSRFFPRHWYSDRQATPLESLRRLYAVATKRLKHVYLGNV